MDTPEFLVWAIEYTCMVRAQQDGSDPERTERQLRAARAVSDARCEGRVIDGVCVDPPLGFRIDEALQVYGGLQAVENACRGCAANALAQEHSEALAGCYGDVPLPADPRPFHDAIERAIELAGSRQEFRTQPRWYSLWLDSPLSAEVLLDTILILQAAPIADPRCRAATDELMAGLNAAFNAGCSVHVQLYPPGRVEGAEWTLNSHCPVCRAQWPDKTSHACRVCGFEGHPAPEKRRKARGQRPYIPLERLLGQPQAAEFLVRYEALRAGPKSPDQAQNQPPPAPPGNPPAG
ncbi:MAG TPA: hypothetical protein VFV87_18860 [Pirellulaceae bacterium]|nr:hypothetical protein [Pirellulaceae bacterium]